jgi:hypothetical protein
VKDTRETPSDTRTVVAAWDFPSSPKKGVLTLWPKETTTPDRKKHSVTTRSDTASLGVTIDGPDPYLYWQFEQAINTTALRVVVDAPRGGPFEFFWSSRTCPTFTQACGVTFPLPAGRSTVVLFLDAREQTRAVRIDLPDLLGETFSFDAIDVLGDAHVDATWVGRPDHTALETTPEGLVLHAGGDDPWVTLLTPGLVAERVTAVELVLTAPEASAGSREPPELYWDGSCGGFVQGCAKPFGHADSGALTHRVELGPSDKWSGPIHALRLDPGSTGGDYVIERFALVRGNPE